MSSFSRQSELHTSALMLYEQAIGIVAPGVENLELPSFPKAPLSQIINDGCDLEALGHLVDGAVPEQFVEVVESHRLCELALYVRSRSAVLEGIVAAFTHLRILVPAVVSDLIREANVIVLEAQKETLVSRVLVLTVSRTSDLPVHYAGG